MKGENRRDNIFRRAREEVTVPELLERYGFPLRRVGSTLRSSRCPACGQSSHRSVKLVVWEDRWYCHRCEESGDVITAVQWLEGLGAKDAALFLLGEEEPRRERKRLKQVEPPKRSSFDEEEKKRLEAVKKAVEALISVARRGAGSRKRIWEYLTREKRIPERIVREALKRGIVYFLPDNPFQLKQAVLEHISEDVLRKAGLLKEQTDKKTGEIKTFLKILPRRPVLTPFRSNGSGITGAEFRSVDGADPKTIAIGRIFPWWWKGEGRDVLLTEGLTDFLSAPAMGWRGNVLGLTGVGQVRNPRIKECFRKLLSQGFKLFPAFDNDEAGRKALEALEEEFEVSGVFIPPPGKDLNDVLRDGGHIEDIREHYEEAGYV